MHASAWSLIFFSQGRDTAAWWRQGRTGKTSEPLGAGDSCRSISSLYASVWETNRRPFGARCGDDLLWIILDNQHPWCNIS
ncbi:hypothetical protein P4S95_18325 [Aneurinibacillus aneurinilyticus]|uniref:hypothetical protein n=1 Tax=Aneurinibacillus aneurinilyticus TaxID=1391 RepID=UPI002E1B0A00|nr:hypothetical protein [Aneurinibacillus aneurinilyticus]